jgi:2-methylcitrate dehydratase PrpD
MAQHCLLDWLAVSVRGSREPLVDILVTEALERGAHGPYPVIGRNERLTLVDAALVTGSAAHVLDYDDGNRAGGHLTAPIASALLPLAMQLRSSGREVINAFVAGYELSARVGFLIQPGHYARGFHPTATLGTFGAAAACARLLGLNAELTEQTLGIAATSAAGLVASFGTMCKPLHVGRAAMNGLLAARLARHGFTGQRGALEHKFGFAASHSDDFNSPAALAAPAAGFHLLANVFKFHAACAGTHALIDALTELRDAQALTPALIDCVIVDMNPRMDKVCNIAVPATGLEAKFSMRMAAVLALAGIDTSAPDIFTDELVQRPALTQLRDRITVRLSEAIAPLDVEVELALKDGRRLHARRKGDQPETDLDQQRRRLETKASRLIESALGIERCRALISAIGSLATAEHVGELLELAVDAESCSAGKALG